MSDIAYPEDSPRAVLPRAVVQNLLADPCNHIMTYDSDSIKDIISSALIYGMPLFDEAHLASIFICSTKFFVPG